MAHSSDAHSSDAQSPAVQAVSDASSELDAEEALVEEVSIDGMCGVY